MLVKGVKGDGRKSHGTEEPGGPRETLQRPGSVEVLGQGQQGNDWWGGGGKLGWEGKGLGCP